MNQMPKPIKQLLETLAATTEGTVDVPNELTLFTVADVTLKEHDEDESKPRKFSMLGHAGTIMDHPWLGKLAFDVSGIKVDRKAFGALLDHDPSQRVGRITSVTKQLDETPHSLSAEGTFLKRSKAALQVLSDHEDGFPWEASIRTTPSKLERLEEGAKATVNGQEMVGPGLIVRTSTLKEISFVALGADHLTSAEALADGNGSTVATFTVTKSEETLMAKKDEGQAAVAMPEKFSIDELKSAYHDTYTEALSLGITQERERVAEILEETHQRQMPLALKLIADGSTVKAAYKALLHEKLDNATKRHEDLEETSDESLDADTDADTKAGQESEENAETRWEKMSASQHQEFNDSFDIFAAYEKANALGLVKIRGAR